MHTDDSDATKPIHDRIRDAGLNGNAWNAALYVGCLWQLQGMRMGGTYKELDVKLYHHCVLVFFEELASRAILSHHAALRRIACCCVRVGRLHLNRGGQGKDTTTSATAEPIRWPLDLIE